MSAEFTGSLKFGSFVNNEPKNKIATLNLEKQNEFFIPGVTEGFFITKSRKYGTTKPRALACNPGLGLLFAARESNY